MKKTIIWSNVEPPKNYIWVYGGKEYEYNNSTKSWTESSYGVVDYKYYNTIKRELVSNNTPPSDNNLWYKDGEVYVCINEKGDTWESIKHDYSKDYLTFKILSDGDVIWGCQGLVDSGATIEYKKNDGEWTSVTATPIDNDPDTGSITGGTRINVSTGDSVQFRGNNNVYFDSDAVFGTFVGSYIRFNVEGNIMSLIYGDDFADKKVFPADSSNNFMYFFTNSTIISAENLILPATTLADYCYTDMFTGCTSLTTAPVLPATTLTEGCYADMFYNCASLTTAPELPATTLANNCYNSMFKGCTSLTTAPALPATTLADGCYDYMFYNCTLLNYIKCLATDISADECTYGWVSGVSANGTFERNENTDWPVGDNGVPSGWEVVPESVWPVHIEFSNSPSVTVDGVSLEMDNYGDFILENDETHNYVDALSCCQYYIDSETGNSIDLTSAYFVTNATLKEIQTNLISWTIPGQNAYDTTITMEPVSNGVRISFMFGQQEI